MDQPFRPHEGQKLKHIAQGLRIELLDVTAKTVLAKSICRDPGLERTRRIRLANLFRCSLPHPYNLAA